MTTSKDSNGSRSSSGMSGNRVKFHFSRREASSRTFSTAWDGSAMDLRAPRAADAWAIARCVWRRRVCGSEADRFHPANSAEDRRRFGGRIDVRPACGSPGKTMTDSSRPPLLLSLASSRSRRVSNAAINDTGSTRASLSRTAQCMGPGDASSRAHEAHGCIGFDRMPSAGRRFETNGRAASRDPTRDRR